MTAPAITPTSDTPRLRRQPLSYEAYLALPDESRIIEWVNGEVIFHVPPTPIHQSIVFYLSRLMGGFIEFNSLGQVLAAPVEVKLWGGGPSREPDLLFIANDRLDIIGEKRIEGPPDLIVEIVSPASLTLDRVTKFREYEQAGVGEYWIIDPRPYQQQADFYVRGADGLFAPAPVDSDGVYASVVVPSFRLRVAWLWQSPLPNPQRALAEMLADAPGLSDELRALYREMLRLLP
jgi:Uma2 family endonuclease